jgi:hypothetical protein
VNVHAKTTLTEPARTWSWQLSGAGTRVGQGRSEPAFEGERDPKYAFRWKRVDTLRFKGGIGQGV